jgi:hypothetical protein
MPNTLSEYYTDELKGWKNSIGFYNEEIIELTLKLAYIVRRNSIVGISEKVEAHQARLNHVSDTFGKLQIEMELQEAVLITDSTFIDDTLINTDMEKRQNNLRHQMVAAEKEYIDVKFDCYNFISGTLKK